MSSLVLGACSICGGSVKVPLFWWGVTSPTPMCSECGAVPRNRARGQVIEMEPMAKPSSSLFFYEDPDRDTWTTSSLVFCSGTDSASR